MRRFSLCGLRGGHKNFDLATVFIKIKLKKLLEHISESVNKNKGPFTNLRQTSRTGKADVTCLPIHPPPLLRHLLTHPPEIVPELSERPLSSGAHAKYGAHATHINCNTRSSRVFISFQEISDKIYD